MMYFIENDWPDVWKSDMVAKKLEVYPWLLSKKGRIGCKYCRATPVPNVDKKSGLYANKEWSTISVGFNHGDTRPHTTKLSMLRSKISQHLKSAAHQTSADIFKRKAAGPSQTEKLIARNYEKHQTATEMVFRVAYNVAKMDRPYTDFPQHLDCYKASNINMGTLLHTDKSCAEIISSIASYMRLSLINRMISSGSKFSILANESTTVSNQSGLVIHLRACFSTKPTTFFLDIAHVPKVDSKSIADTIPKTLVRHGLTEEFVKENLICFASDGASVMTGIKSGVGALLLKQYPNLILWHCANHRLELAVNDAVEEVSGINHFKIFLDSLYKTYSQSPKLLEELKECACSLQAEVFRVGRVLDTRWSASSLRTVKSVWISHAALVAHFQIKSESKFQGFLNIILSQNFIINLSVMYDALEEVSRLSLSLQGRDISLVAAHRLIDQTIKAVDELSSKPGRWQVEAQETLSTGEFKGNEFSDRHVPAINPSQSYRSLRARNAHH